MICFQSVTFLHGLYTQVTETSTLETMLTTDSGSTRGRHWKGTVQTHFPHSGDRRVLLLPGNMIVVYYESRKRELKIRLMNEGWYNKILKARVEESTCLTYTGFHDKTN